MGKLKSPKYIIDGDLICYIASSATDGREYVVSWEIDGGTRLHRIHKYKRDADLSVRELESIGVNGIKCELEFHPEPVGNALKIVKDSLVSLETALLVHTDGLGERKIFLSRGGSFREKEVPSYKQLREGVRRPEHLEACKDYLVKYHGAECMPGEFEADDLMAMEASKGEPCVVCSLDKDLLQIPGHHFNWNKGEYTIVTEEEGWRHLFSQLLTGDTADGIPGIHGIGPKKAEKILKGIEDPFMMYVEVLKAYVKDTGVLEGESQEDYHRRVVLLVREHISLLYLIRRPGERFQVPPKGSNAKDTTAI